MTTAAASPLPGGSCRSRPPRPRRSGALALAACLALLAPAAAAGQEAAVPPAGAEAGGISLEDALRRAEASAESVRVAEAELARAAAGRRQARSLALPQLQGAGGYSRTLASEFEDIQLDLGGGDGGGGFGDLPFGQVNTYRLGLSLQQPLWTAGRVAGQVGAADAVVGAAEQGLAAARAELALEVTRVYFDALLAERLVEITEATLTQAEEAHRQTRLAFEVGDQSEFDLLRAQVARDNQRPELLQRLADRELAHLRLARLLGLPEGETPRLTTGFADFDHWRSHGAVPAAAERQAWVQALGDERTPVAQAREGVEARRQLLRAARGERWPNLSLGSDYGRVAYPGGGLPGWSEMRTNWTVGVSFGVPLFSGGRVEARVAEAQAEVDAATARLDEVRELARLDAREALERLAAAEAVWQASAGTVEQAQRAHEIAELRYREGLSTQLELSDARVLLQQAQATRALAARNLQVARARVALLADLPLGAGSEASPSASASAASPLAAARRGGVSPGAF